MKVFGIVGWKNSGKTGVMERLVAEIAARGFAISTMKHAHHSFDVDHEGRDSFRHRAAGASQVMLSSRNRWALMNELRDAPELGFEELLAKMDPVDLVLVEGFKTHTHPKMECHLKTTKDALIAPNDPTILGVASNEPLPDLDRPVLDIDDASALADFVLQQVGLA